MKTSVQPCYHSTFVVCGRVLPRPIELPLPTHPPPSLFPSATGPLLSYRSRHQRRRARWQCVDLFDAPIVAGRPTYLLTASFAGSVGSIGHAGRELSFFKRASGGVVTAPISLPSHPPLLQMLRHPVRHTCATSYRSDSCGMPYLNSALMAP